MFLMKSLTETQDKFLKKVGDILKGITKETNEEILEKISEEVPRNMQK